MKCIPFPASADAYAWNRQDNLPKGFRLYSNAQWVRWMKDIPEPASAAEREYQLSLPELPSRFYDLDLEAEAPTEGRYMSLTQRYERMWEVSVAFPTRRLVQLRPHGQPIFLENHGPTDKWRADTKKIWAELPKNDSDIFARPAVMEKPKLAHLADKLALLLQWARMSKPLPLDASNWLEADNDNYFDGEEPAPKPASNRERRIRPGSSYEELRSYIAKAGPYTVRKYARLGGGYWELMPADLEWAKVIDRQTNDGKVSKSHQVIIRAGKLRLANGKRHEQCTVRKGGKPEGGSARVPEGAILFQPDKFGELLGPEPDPDEIDRRRSYWSSLFGTARSHGSDEFRAQELEPIRFRKAGRVRRKVLITPEEQKALLAGPKPPITYCKPGLPCGHEDIGAQFVGGWMSSTKGKAGVERWEDISDELSRRTEFVRWAAALPPEQIKAMDLACTVANFREIGEAFGKTGKNAERYGKKILVASNDNLKKIMAA